MKRIVCAMLIILPVVCFGQSPNQGKIVDRFPIRSNSPLYIVDGIQMKDNFNPESINCDDVKSLELLKGSHATAIYGTRGIDGVYIITTKEGKYIEAAKENRIDKRMLSLEASRLSINDMIHPLYDITEFLTGCLCNPVFIIPEDKYETIVIAPGYESFSTTQKSKEFYTESYLKTKNVFMVNEWNYRYSNPSRYNPNIYEASIDYDPNTDYGLDVEYELYMFFRFMEKQNKMSLIGDRATAQL